MSFARKLKRNALKKDLEIPQLKPMVDKLGFSGMWKNRQARIKSEQEIENKEK